MLNNYCETMTEFYDKIEEIKIRAENSNEDINV